MEQLEFFSVANLATLAGAIAATKIITTVVCNYQPAWSPKTVAGVVTLLIQVFVWAARGPLAGAGADWVALVVAILSAAVVYVGATGVNAMTAGRIEAELVRGRASSVGRGSRRWY